VHYKCKHIKGILLRLSGDYPDSLRILLADRPIIREAYPAYPPQLCKLRSAELRARLPLSFVRQRSRKAPRLQADAELAALSGPPQRLAEACKIDMSHNVGNRVITVGIVNEFRLYVVLMFQTVQMGIRQNFEVLN